jgi:flagellar protein FlbT
MPLKLKLAANERLIVNGAVIYNGGCRTTLVIRNYAHIMREKDVLQEPDVNTPTKRLYFLVQVMLMQPPPPPQLMDSYRLAYGQLCEAYIRAENIAVLHEVNDLVDTGDYYKALMKLQPLIAYEAGLLHMRPHEWRRSSQREAAAAAPATAPGAPARPAPATTRTAPAATRPDPAATRPSPVVVRLETHPRSRTSVATAAE